MSSADVSLSDEYKRQYGWRDWPRIFEALPPLQGQTVLDLGCGVGETLQDRELSFDGPASPEGIEA